MLVLSREEASVHDPLPIPLLFPNYYDELLAEQRWGHRSLFAWLTLGVPPFFLQHIQETFRVESLNCRLVNCEWEAQAKGV